jgi:hypothetical protein
MFEAKVEFATCRETAVKIFMKTKKPNLKSKFEIPHPKILGFCFFEFVSCP